MSLGRRFGTGIVSPAFPAVASTAAVVVALALLMGQSAHAQSQLIPGRNVNMVSGTKWPDGDPYLQRQNEPSVAASTRNPLHLLAGANDYRTVDIPNPNDGGAETGDAWLGLFKSFDGGQRWQSTLLPGYPQDTSPEGTTSPLYGYQAGADPVVRAGTNGLFYYAGLVLDRGTGGKNAIFVARFIDNNNKEANYRTNTSAGSNDPVQYLGTNIVAASPGTKFFDKPWMAVDIPRTGRTCRIPGAGKAGNQVVPAGNVYVAFSSITRDSQGLKSEIMFTTSSDCGTTWSAPIRISRAADRIN
jgi:hypothetical protein